MQAQGSVNPGHTLLVLAGDTPLLEGKTLKKLLDFHQQQQAQATVLSALLPNPYGYGRIIRQADGGLERIVEEKDADPEEKEIAEINTGMYCFQAGTVFTALSQVQRANAQGEYYLTDVLPILKNDGHKVAAGGRNRAGFSYSKWLGGSPGRRMWAKSTLGQGSTFRLLLSAVGP